MTVVFGIIVVFLFMALLFAVGVLYGVDLGAGDCDNFIEWVKNEYELQKEIIEEYKAEKAFLKVNPLCRECDRHGKCKKATRCIRFNGELISVCEEHYASKYKKYKMEENENEN